MPCALANVLTRCKIKEIFFKIQIKSRQVGHFPVGAQFQLFCVLTAFKDYGEFCSSIFVSRFAQLVELVDTLGLEPSAARHGGSSPSLGTNQKNWFSPLNIR